MRRLRLVWCLLAMIGCGEPVLDGRLALDHATSERVSGTYARGGVGVKVDAVQTDILSRVVVQAANGEELLRMERTGDLIVSTAFGGRAKVTTDLSYLRLSNEMAAIPEDQRPDFSLVGAVIEEGDPHAFTDLELRPEYALLPWLSREFGVQGLSGKAAPATLGFHMIATQAARDLSIELPPIELAVQEQGYCLDLQSDPHGNDALGMCGPGMSCWSWVCGDCCCHDGCKSHDNSCRNCKWYKPWNCFLCASFTSFFNGACGTGCQADDYGEPTCTALWGNCSDSSQCCNHYANASEAAPGAVNVICSSFGNCIQEGSCRNNCGGNSGTCSCEEWCSYYGNCCWDRSHFCEFSGPLP